MPVAVVAVSAGVVASMMALQSANMAASTAAMSANSLLASEAMRRTANPAHIAQVARNTVGAGRSLRLYATDTHKPLNHPPFHVYETQALCETDRVSLSDNQMYGVCQPEGTKK